MRISLVSVSLTLGALAGCGGSTGKTGTFDCAFLASDNCWKTTAALAAACLPPSSDIGIMSADGKTCTYPSGDVVTFTPPLLLPAPLAGIWNFTVTTASGAPCLTYQDDGYGKVVLTVQGKTVKVNAPSGMGISLTCPDETTYSSSSTFLALTCPDSGPSPLLPGTIYSISPSSASLSLADTTDSYGSELVFSCELAPS